MSAFRFGSNAMGFPFSSDKVMLAPVLRFFPRYLYSFQGLFRLSALCLKKVSFAFLIARVNAVLAFRKSFFVSRVLYLECLLRDSFRFRYKDSRSEVHQVFIVNGCFSVQDLVAAEKMDSERSLIA